MESAVSSMRKSLKPKAIHEFYSMFPNFIEAAL